MSEIPVTFTGDIPSYELPECVQLAGGYKLINTLAEEIDGPLYSSQIVDKDENVVVDLSRIPEGLHVYTAGSHYHYARNTASLYGRNYYLQGINVLEINTTQRTPLANNPHRFLAALLHENVGHKGFSMMDMMNGF
jgi:hypothetical protein